MPPVGRIRDKDTRLMESCDVLTAPIGTWAERGRFAMHRREAKGEYREDERRHGCRHTIGHT